MLGKNVLWLSMVLQSYMLRTQNVDTHAEVVFIKEQKTCTTIARYTSRNDMHTLCHICKSDWFIVLQALNMMKNGECNTPVSVPGEGGGG